MESIDDKKNKYLNIKLILKKCQLKERIGQH
jgi:hypothetical protein